MLWQGIHITRSKPATLNLLPSPSFTAHSAPVDRNPFGASFLPAIIDPPDGSTTSDIQSILRAIRAGVPTYGSLIGYKIFLLLCEHELRQERLRLKDLYLDLRHSHGAVRRLVKRMQDDDWIVVETSSRDRRARFVLPTARLQRAIARHTPTSFASASALPET